MHAKPARPLTDLMLRMSLRAAVGTPARIQDVAKKAHQLRFRRTADDRLGAQRPVAVACLAHCPGYLACHSPSDSPPLATGGQADATEGLALGVAVASIGSARGISPFPPTGSSCGAGEGVAIEEAAGGGSEGFIVWGPLSGKLLRQS